MEVREVNLGRSDGSSLVSGALAVLVRLRPLFTAFIVGGFFGLPIGSLLNHQKVSQVKREDWYVESLESTLVQSQRRIFELTKYGQSGNHTLQDSTRFGGSGATGVIMRP